jgi:hypothetical protein
MMVKKLLKEPSWQVALVDRENRKSAGSHLCMFRGVQKVFVNLATTDDQTGKLIECTEERGESTVEEGKSASTTDGPKNEENEGEELEKL